MKKTLFYSIIGLKSLIGFGNPVTQREIEDELNKLEKNHNISVQYYKNFACPSLVNFNENTQNLENNFFKKFSKEEIEEDIYKSEASAFEKYSRKFDTQNLSGFKKIFNETSVRIVDFESIVNGFDEEELKSFSKNLNNDDAKLRREVANWIKQKTIYACLTSAYSFNESVVYIPNASIEKTCKDNLLRVVDKLLGYKVGQQMLNLVLSIEKFKQKTLKFFITNHDNAYYTSNAIFLDLTSNVILEAKKLYEQLNVWVHRVLGLKPSSKIAGNFSTDFEKNFLGLRANDFYQEKAAEMKEEDAIPLVENPWNKCENKETALKIFDIQTTIATYIGANLSKTDEPTVG